MSDDFDRRLKAGLRDLADAVPTAPIHPPTTGPVRRVRPRARAALPFGSLLVAGLIVVAAVLIAPRISPAGTTPTATPSGAPAGSSVATATVLPSPSPNPDRYGDGIPRVWEGQPVLRGQAAIDAANASTDESSFLVAFWAGIELPHGCVALGAGDNVLYMCGGMTDVGDQPGVRSNALGKALRVDTISPQVLSSPAFIPTIQP